MDDTALKLQYPARLQAPSEASEGNPLESSRVNIQEHCSAIFKLPFTSQALPINIYTEPETITSLSQPAAALYFHIRTITYETDFFSAMF